MTRKATSLSGRTGGFIVCLLMALAWATPRCAIAAGEGEVALPEGVRAVWDLEKAYGESTDTRGRVCINGLWRWQPADPAARTVPADGWGFFKVPGAWPGITNYMQKDSQTVHVNPSWQDVKLNEVKAAWYQREITVPEAWIGHRIAVRAAYVNSYAVVYIDGRRIDDLHFPAGEVDVTDAVRPGGTHSLSMLVVAMPLNAVMLSYSDSNSARNVQGSVARRGLCGDVWLVGEPAGPRITDVKVDTSVQDWQITFEAALEGLDPGGSYVLRARLAHGDVAGPVITGDPFVVGDLAGSRVALTTRWQPPMLWDTHTPENTYFVGLSLLDGDYDVLDEALPVRFGFREFWIDGRDFYLNGTRIYISAIPYDNAQVGAAAATYEAARETMERLQSFGINLVYTHNYGCQPGSHLSFEDVLRAADDTGMLIAFSQPHAGHYQWGADDADESNGYAQHAEFYVRVAQNHPSVVAYSMNHNSTGHADDMNPDKIDGREYPRGPWSARNTARALRAEAIVKGLDPGRIVYHHSSGSLSSMHTSNFYANFVPMQEMADWFEHWATEGIKPLFLVEFGVPFPWDWTMYRGWYEGKRAFGSADVPWEFCLAEWNAQFLGDAAFRISEREKVNLRWEAPRFARGEGWHRWDYPTTVGSGLFEERHPILAAYLEEETRAFRTWGVSAFGPWGHGQFWLLKDGVDKSRVDLPTDWEGLQRPGLSPDFIDVRYERFDLAFEASDWEPTAGAEVLVRNNRSVLAYIAGEPERFTSKDHNFLPGEVLEKQVVVINNTRAPLDLTCAWSLILPEVLSGSQKASLATGEQVRIPLRFELPEALPAGQYELKLTAEFSTGETQTDAFAVHVLPKPSAPRGGGSIALFDPEGETTDLLAGLGVQFAAVAADGDLSAYDTLVIGKGALSVDGPAPDVSRVRDGLKVIAFEQTADALEKRLGFRVAQYGLRQVFRRLPDHALLAGLEEEHLGDWRGEATILPSRLDYVLSDKFNTSPTVVWCGIEVTRAWRAGNRGNVASVLIEKPTRGDFLPIVDGGFSLQYSPLMEYREGSGMVLFCQMDVTGRTGPDPAADTLVRNVLSYVSAWEPTSRREAVYVGEPAGQDHLASAGLSIAPFDAAGLSAGQVLVVGPGGGRELADSAAAVGDWLAAGGNLLAVGLDTDEANAFLPAKVAMISQEHIAAYFEQPASASLLAGVGPADVHNRAPRELPLVAAGATRVGNGVLAQLDDANVVFCQIAPWDYDYADNFGLKKTFLRTSFLVSRLLGNMGCSGETPLLARFGEPTGGVAGDSILLNGDFSADADGDGLADEWTIDSGAQVAACSREQIGDGWAQVIDCPPGTDDPTVMLAQHDAPVSKDQWYRISFKARAEDLTAGVTLTIMATDDWRTLLEYQRFTPKDDWESFDFQVQANDNAEQTRFQIWHEGTGTLALADVRVVPIKDPTIGRWLDGLYLDEPVDWDDPYRFFRW